FFQAEDGIRDRNVTGVQTCALPIFRHIPEKHFKMIRYGGLYARHRKIDRKLYHVIPKEKHKKLRSFDRWQEAILHSFGYDPLERSEERRVGKECREREWAREGEVRR